MQKTFERKSMPQRNLMSLEYLRKSEIQTRSKTQTELFGIHQNIPNAMDVLLKLPYFRGEVNPPNTDRGTTQVFIWESYVTCPYTFAALYSLYETGNYLESAILLRHLLEIFIQIRFFWKHPAKAKGHLLCTNRIPLAKMYEDLAPGSKPYLYDIHYGGLLSGFTHGGLPKSIFRIQRKSESEGTIVLGNEYCERWAGYVSGQLVVLLFGFINKFRDFFPKNTLWDDSSVFDQMEGSKNWLKSCMDADKKENPTSHEWYSHIDKIIA